MAAPRTPGNGKTTRRDRSAAATSATPAPEAEPPEQPVQYYSRSELPQQGVTLHQLSPRRKSTLVVLSLLASVCLITTGAVVFATALPKAEDALEQGNVREAQRIIAQARKIGLPTGASGTATLLAAILIITRSGPRIFELERWIRRMGAGDLNYSVKPVGHDEITEVAYDLEVLRRQSVRAQRLDVVQELSAQLHDKNAELEQVLETLHNTQDQMISRQKLAELGELTAGVAHEIRNPLNFIQNFSQTSTDMIDELTELISELNGPPDDEQRATIEELRADITSNMERIRYHGDRASRIITDMLAMGRSTKGNYHEVAVNHLVEDHAMLAFHAARSQDEALNVNIVCDLNPDVGVAHLVSEDIGRVILNLVGNACYAAWKRDQREPEHQPTVWLHTDIEGDLVKIAVRDNGDGIPDDVRDKIFNPFFTTKPADEGTGLGLSLSNDVVREHGGSISVESVSGEYTQFTVTLPQRPTADATDMN